jgi:hypothetical protein
VPASGVYRILAASLPKLVEPDARGLRTGSYGRRMDKVRLTIAAGLIAAAAVLGLVAVTRTTAIGTAQHRSADAALAARIRRLDRYEASLRRELARKPPALPALPARRATASAPRVVYRRPPAIVVVHRTHRGDDGFAEADGGGGDD